MKTRYCGPTIAILILVLLLSLLVPISKSGTGGEKKVLLGTKGRKLELITKCDPLQISIYSEIASTNEVPDYGVFQGHEPIILSEKASSNTYQTIHFEEAVAVLETRRDATGRLVERSLTHTDDSTGRKLYSYVDKNGDGLWDIFITYGKAGKGGTMLMQSNMCWVPFEK